MLWIEASDCIIKRVAFYISLFYFVESYLLNYPNIQEVLEVTLNGGWGYEETNLEVLDSIHLLWIVCKHLDDFSLALIDAWNIKIGRGDLTLLYFPLQVNFQVVKCQLQHPKVVSNEIANVHSVYFSVEKCLFVGFF